MTQDKLDGSRNFDNMFKIYVKEQKPQNGGMLDRKQCPDESAHSIIDSMVSNTARSITV